MGNETHNLRRQLAQARARIAELEAELEERLRNTVSAGFVDASPDGGYAIRALQKLRRDCDMVYSDSTSVTENTSEFCQLMNELQRKRAAELDAAIEVLRRA